MLDAGRYVNGQDGRSIEMPSQIKADGRF